jgi:hypothetical protein
MIPGKFKIPGKFMIPGKLVMPGKFRTHPKNRGWGTLRVIAIAIEGTPDGVILVAVEEPGLSAVTL